MGLREPGEAPEAELWTRWLAPEFPAEKIAPLGAELTYQFRQSMGRRVVVDGGKEVVEELLPARLYPGDHQQPDYITGNPGVAGSRGFAPYFKSVVLSVGLWKAQARSGHLPGSSPPGGGGAGPCAYVGDNLKRDVTGTRAAGFGMVIIMISPEEMGCSADHR